MAFVVLVDDAGVGELEDTVTKHGGRDTIALLGQSAESDRAVTEFPHDAQQPPMPEKIQRRHERSTARAASDGFTGLGNAVDSLHESSDLTDDLWERLRSVFDERQVLDLLMLTGWYHAISFAARAARIPLEPGAPRFADVIAPG